MKLRRELTLAKDQVASARPARLRLKVEIPLS